MENTGNNTSSSSDQSISSYSLVQSTIKDLFHLQQDAFEKVKQTAERQKQNYVTKSHYEEVAFNFEQERMENAKTKILLEKENEKLKFALNEVKILKEQMAKDEKEYSATLRSLQSRSTRETTRCDYLLKKCSAADKELERLNDCLALKDNEIKSLKQRLKSQKDTHKQTLVDIDINKMQQMYMTKSLGDSLKKTKN